MLLSPGTLASTSTLLGDQIAAPEYDAPNLFGSLIGLPNIEDAVTGTLATWLPTCLFEVERRNGLKRGSVPRPPSDSSIFADLEFDFAAGAWREDDCPVVIAAVNPTGETERNADGYGSWFELQVAANVISEEPRVARRWAGWYGLAISMALGQHPSLGGIATSTIMVAAPSVEHPEPDKRVLARALVVFHTFVDGIVNPLSGPKTATPPDSPQYPGSPGQPWHDLPAVESTPLTITARPQQ